MSNTPNEKSAATALTEYLVKGEGYDRLTPIQRAVQGRISAMTDELADEIVKETPGLEEVLRTRITEVIARAMRDNTWLFANISEAVARVLTKHALGSPE